MPLNAAVNAIGSLKVGHTGFQFWQFRSRPAGAILAIPSGSGRAHLGLRLQMHQECALHAGEEVPF